MIDATTINIDLNVDDKNEKIVPLNKVYYVESKYASNIMLQTIALIDSFRVLGIKVALNETKTTEDRLVSYDQIETDLSNSINKIRGIEPVTLKIDKQ